MNYRKFCYWVLPEKLEKLKKDFEEKGLAELEETQIPCRVLKASSEVAWVSESAWRGFCARRTSWYWSSDKVGQYLIVSQKPIEQINPEGCIMISDSDFKPLQLPSSAELVELINSKEFQMRKPSSWEKVEESEKEFYQSWFQRRSPNTPFDFNKLFASHSANHSNFINPKFFVIQDGEKSPYSIGESLWVCSSCLEFFNILGSQWKTKYVVPCMGAVLFARLPMDRYFEVKTFRSRSSQKAL